MSATSRRIGFAALRARIWLPGEKSQLRRLENERLGIPLPPQLAATLDALADELEIPRLG